MTQVVTETAHPSKAVQTLAFSSTAPGAATVNGNTYTVDATGGGSPRTLTFTSATPTVGAVSGSTVSFIAAGTFTVNVDQSGDTTHDAAPQVQQTFTVSLPLVIGTVFGDSGTKEILFTGSAS